VSQFGFVGPSYEAANPLQDAQRLINWYPEIDKAEGAKTVIGLLGCPGLVPVNSSYSGEVRGAWVFPGNTRCLFIIGNQAVLAAVNAPASGTAQATFTFSTLGTLSTSTGQVGIRDNGPGGIVVIVDGTYGYVYTPSTNSFVKIADPAFLGSDRVVFIDGWLGFNKPDSQTFYVSPVYWNGINPIDGTFFALKDSSTDRLVTHIENNREWWLIGERTTEIWVDEGGATFPFSRLQGSSLQVGCAAKHTVARTGNALIWLARSERGENMVVAALPSYQYKVISTPAVAQAISKYAVVSDAHGYTYTEEGHEFYVLTFPTADVTWVYDLTTEMWHQRASFDQATGLFHRARMNCIVNFADQRLVGDYANGGIYQLTRSAYSDAGAPLVCVRRTPHVWDQADRNRVRHDRLQVEFTPGVGLASGQGSSPKAMLRWSDDGGFNWGNEHWTSIGAQGQTKNRAIWRRLGAARDRVYEARFSDPVQRDVVGASLILEGTEA